jgi:polyadenylate-binding protein
MAVNTTYNSASLYVGDLNPDVTEANLFEIFNTVGAVASIRVCRDAITRRSLGYAYVNFHAAADADRALDQLNNAPIKGKPCRIMWSQRDPASRKSGKGNIFIKNLDKSIDHKTLFDTFSQFGQILSCKIELDDRNESKGYGYIQFALQDQAEKAIAKVNNMMLAGKKVFVGPFVSHKERLAANSTKQFTNVYVKNLAEVVDEARLKTLFAKYGSLKNVIIMRDDKGTSKGFGFVNFENPEEAERAVEDLNNTDLDGKPVFVGRAQKKSEREAELRQKFEVMKMEHMSKYQGVNLYIKNLDDDVNDDKLRSMFDPFGIITSAKIMSDPKGNSKGFGFVCFTTPEEATKAVTEMNGKIVGHKPVYVALAQRKDVRKAQLEAQFAQRTKMMPRVPGMPGAPMAYGGAPMFYPQPVVYPPQMVPPRGRYPPAPYGQPVPNYVIVGPQGGRGQVKNGGRGGMAGGRGRGGRPQGGQPQIPAMMAPVPPVAAAAPGATDPSGDSLSAEERKNIMGERLYFLISKPQPSLAGKITGMILDSCTVEELYQLIEEPASLEEKIEEALKVLEEHSKQQ